MKTRGANAAEIATSWNGWGMTTGSVSLHSWNDGAEDDEALPAMSSNYNARLDPKEDFDNAMRVAREREHRATNQTNPQSRHDRSEGRSLRSRLVRPAARLGGDQDGGQGGGSIW
jgi:WD repeat-containing protein 23